MFIIYLTERSIVVSEYHGKTLQESPPKSLGQIMRFAQEVLEALTYLNSKGLVHRSLSPENILFGDDGKAQLFNYGLYYMTGGGADVLFPIGFVQ